MQKDGQTKELYLGCNQALKEHVRNLLLQAFGEEANGSARHKIGDAVAEIARQLADAGGLPFPLSRIW